MCTTIEPTDSTRPRSKWQRLRQKEPRWVWLIAVRGCAVVCAAVGLLSFGLAKDAFGISGLTASLIFNSIYLALPIYNGYILHPGFDVGFDLAIWITLAILGTFACLFSDWSYSSVYYSYSSQTGYYSYSSHIRRAEISGLTFLFICLVQHFILFVYGCCRTHKRRIAKKIMLRNIITATTKITGTGTLELQERVDVLG